MVEGTAGNTGIGLAHICLALGYKCVIYMPNNQSKVTVNVTHLSVLVLKIWSLSDSFVNWPAIIIPGLPYHHCCCSKLALSLYFLYACAIFIFFVILNYEDTCWKLTFDTYVWRYMYLYITTFFHVYFQEKIEVLETLGAEVRPVPVVPWTDPDNYNHQAGRPIL